MHNIKQDGDTLVYHRGKSYMRAPYFGAWRITDSFVITLRVMFGISSHPQYTTKVFSKCNTIGYYLELTPDSHLIFAYLLSDGSEYSCRSLHISSYEWHDIRIRIRCGLVEFCIDEHEPVLATVKCLPEFAPRSIDVYEPFIIGGFNGFLRSFEVSESYFCPDNVDHYIRYDGELSTNVSGLEYVCPNYDHLECAFDFGLPHVSFWQDPPGINEKRLTIEFRSRYSGILILARDICIELVDSGRVIINGVSTHFASYNDDQPHSVTVDRFLGSATVDLETITYPRATHAGAFLGVRFNGEIKKKMDQ